MHIIASGQEELIRRIVAPPLPPGWEFAGARIEGANDAAGDKADEAERRVLDCRGTWNRETSRCDR